MDREQRIRELEELKKSIELQGKVVEEERKRLQELNDEIAIKSISKVPILLFVMDRTLSVTHTYKEYRFVYYFADFDTIKIVDQNIIGDIEDKNLLPYTLDFRKYFNYLNMPPIRINRGKSYGRIVSKPLMQIRKIVNNAFDINDFSDWDEVREYLDNVYLKNHDKEINDRCQHLLEKLSTEERKVLCKMLSQEK